MPGSMGGVAAPSDLRLPQPAPAGFDVVFIQSEPLSDGLAFQQADHLRSAEHPTHQFQRLPQGRAQPTGARTAVGNGERDEPARSFRERKDRIKQGRVGLQIRDHDHDVPWLKGGIVVQPRQQMVAEHFHLADRTVARMDADRIIRILDHQLRLANASLPERQHRILKFSEHGFQVHCREVFLFVMGVAVQKQVEHLPARASERRHETMAFLLWRPRCVHSAPPT